MVEGEKGKRVDLRRGARIPEKVPAFVRTVFELGADKELTPQERNILEERALKGRTFEEIVYESDHYKSHYGVQRTYKSSMKRVWEAASEEVRREFPAEEVLEGEMPKEIREKMRAALSGKPRSEETKSKMRKAQHDKKLTDVHKMRIAQAKKGHKV